MKSLYLVESSFLLLKIAHLEKDIILFRNKIYFGKEGDTMAKNTGNGYRRGSVDDRTQIYNPRIEMWVKRDTITGRFIEIKSDGTPFKGIAKETDGRRS